MAESNAVKASAVAVVAAAAATTIAKTSLQPKPPFQRKKENRHSRRITKTKNRGASVRVYRIIVPNTTTTTTMMTILMMMMMMMIDD